MTEIYKDCEFDNSYKISNFGNIKRQYHNGKVNFLKCSILNHGYKYIQVNRNGKRKNYLIHRLVAIAFITNDNEDYSVIDHIDRNKLNNNVSNLRWCNQTINGQNTDRYRDDIIETGKERDNKLSAGYRKRDIENKKYYCKCCDLATTSNYKLERHLKTDRHKKNMTYSKEEQEQHTKLRLKEYHKEWQQNINNDPIKLKEQREKSKLRQRTYRLNKQKELLSQQSIKTTL